MKLYLIERNDRTEAGEDDAAVIRAEDEATALGLVAELCPAATWGDTAKLKCTSLPSDGPAAIVLLSTAPDY